MTWPVRWSAKLIWLPDSADPTVGALPPDNLLSPPRERWNRFCYLRKDFQLESVPHAVQTRVTADSRFILYVNGGEIAAARLRSLMPRLAYEEVDLAPWLRLGQNVLAAYVRYYGRAVPWWRPSTIAGRLGLGGFALEARSIGVVTDRSWRAGSGPTSRHAGAVVHELPAEVIDGARIRWAGRTRPSTTHRGLQPRSS